MYSSCKRSIRRNTAWSAIYISLKRNILKFDTVLLHSDWSSLRRKYLSKIPTDVNALSCGAKPWNISGISDAISPARHPQKSSQHVRACAAGDGAICSKNRIIVPYHGDNPNTWNGARLRSPSPIMAPDYIRFQKGISFFYCLSVIGIRAIFFPGGGGHRKITLPKKFCELPKFLPNNWVLARVIRLTSIDLHKEWK